MEELKVRIKKACERAWEAREQAKLAEIERMRRAEEAQAQRAYQENVELVQLVEELVEKMEKSTWTTFRVDLPIKGRKADFKYNQGCAPDFVFTKDSFTDKYNKLLKNELKLKVEPKV